MATRHIFLDTSILDTLERHPVLLNMLCHPRRSNVRGVVSLFQWYDISSDGREERRKSRVSLLERLNPLWLKHIVRLKREYVEYRFLRFLRLHPTRPKRFSRSFDAALEAESGKRARSPITLAEGVSMGAKHPRLFASVRSAGQEWVRASAWLQANRHLGNVAPAIVSERFIRRHIPERSPNGLSLEPDRRTIDAFVRRFKWRKVPEFALEAAIFGTNVRWPRHLVASEACDLMAATAAMLHCDGMLHDKRIAELVRRVRPAVPWKLAREFRHRDLGTVVRWIRRAD